MGPTDSGAMAGTTGAGTIDLQKMKSVDAVQPQCPTCSAKQGAEMSKFSIQQRNANGL